MKLSDSDAPSTLAHVFGHPDHAQMAKKLTRAREARVAKRAAEIEAEWGCGPAEAWRRAYREEA